MSSMCGVFAIILLLSDYRRNSHYIGCVVGRVTNRIKGALFVIDNKEYFLTPNEAPNHLHGGAVGFNGIYMNVRTHFYVVIVLTSTMHAHVL